VGQAGARRGLSEADIDEVSRHTDHRSHRWRGREWALTSAPGGNDAAVRRPARAGGGRFRAGAV